jgi:hypothetical protein
MEYIERVKAEEVLKNRIIDTLDDKKRQIQKNFLEYVHESEQDQMNFVRWAREMKAEKGKPETGVANI